MKESEFFLEISRGFALAEKTKCDDVLKFDGRITNIFNCSFLRSARNKYTYEIALGVVDGKAVFKGDKLWSVHSGEEYIAKWYYDELIVTEGGNAFLCTYLSWQPPKPNTVMIELLIDDVTFYIERELDSSENASSRAGRVKAAFSKALEDQND